MVCLDIKSLLNLFIFQEGYIEIYHKLFLDLFACFSQKKSQVNVYLIWIVFKKWWDKNISHLSYALSAFTKLEHCFFHCIFSFFLQNAIPFLIAAPLPCQLVVILHRSLMEIAICSTDEVKAALWLSSLFLWQNSFHCLHQHTSSTPNLSDLTGKLTKSIYVQAAGKRKNTPNFTHFQIKKWK